MSKPFILYACTCGAAFPHLWQLHNHSVTTGHANDLGE